MNNYRLIAQGTIPHKKEWDKNKGVLGVIDFEYMGSAEFEFGAMPHAIGQLFDTSEERCFGSIEVELPDDFGVNPRAETKTVNVRYYVRKAQEAQLREMLSNWKKAHKDFKEWRVGLHYDRAIVFGIDRGYEFFAWTGKLGKKLLMEHCHQSMKLLPIEFDESKTPEQILGI